ncbi:hypothetical protein DIE14_07705 [Burkholderia sp. Bp9017]|nr:hypothetical protein DIE14_07705 [Burkholderia sp. Bp9017]RQZ35936.1 hypothetical protein DIE13_08670 [Burkholderia sp. Bp9016]
MLGSELKKYEGVQGCIPFETQNTVSIDRLAPGEKPPPDSAYQMGLDSRPTIFILIMVIVCKRKAPEPSQAGGFRFSASLRVVPVLRPRR